jgi:hypothetical protein
MTIDILTLILALPFLSICLLLATLMIAADWQSSKEGE